MPDVGSSFTPRAQVTSPTTGMTVTSNRSPMPVPERCVCEKPITVESETW